MHKEEAEFRAKLKDLVDSTSRLSGNYLSHGKAKQILEYDGMNAVPWLLNYLNDCRRRPHNLGLNPWVALEAIHYYVPEEYLPDVPESERGKLDVTLDYYLTWGVYRGLLNKEELF